MNANEAITKIKVMLGLNEETTPVIPEATIENVELAEATLVDGTVVRVDGEFETGKAIFVVTEEGDVPAPDGAHETTEGLIVTTEGGFIVSIEEKAPEEEVEEVEETVVVEEASAEFSDEFVNSIVDTLKPALDKIDALRNDLAGLKAEFSDFKEAPATKKITNNLQDYKATAATQHEARFNALKQIRKDSLNK
jgi:hypothetical protein